MFVQKRLLAMRFDKHFEVVRLFIFEFFFQLCYVCVNFVNELGEVFEANFCPVEQSFDHVFANQVVVGRSSLIFHTFLSATKPNQFRFQLMFRAFRLTWHQTRISCVERSPLISKVHVTGMIISTFFAKLKTI